MPREHYNLHSAAFGSIRKWPEITELYLNINSVSSCCALLYPCYCVGTTEGTDADG